MKNAKKAVLAMSALGLLAAVPARGASIVLTFQGLQNGEEVQNFYNGGRGSLNSGPGPADGAVFTANAVVLTDGKHYIAEPTAPEVMLLGNTGTGGQQISATMNVAGGLISDFSFYYGSIEGMDLDAPQSVQIFSGLNGSGTLLGSQSLMMTPGSSADPANTLAVFTAAPVDIPFAGVAHSVVFTGGNQQIVFDNIQFTTAIPEPLSIVLLTQGTLCILVGVGRQLVAARSRHTNT